MAPNLLYVFLLNAFCVNKTIFHVCFYWTIGQINIELNWIYTHKIVHSSAMYYHNLNVIRKDSIKLLTIKNSKIYF